MKLHDLKPAPRSKKSRKRVGRGISAGGGKTAGRGTKGQKARSGGNLPPYFEGGQLPLVRRLPHKRGFYNPFPTRYAVVNLERLEHLFSPEEEVTPQALHEKGAVKNLRWPVKILGRGELGKGLQVSAHAFSKSAAAKIEAAGGKVKVLPPLAQPQESNQ
ncbi:MAG: 50S ribosomal protein L15 [Chloroflexi bacterium]|nr:50S ribosomal protein L15 [Chloroflexota bacterium]